MVYNRSTRELKTDDGKLLKKLDCPLDKKWAQLKMIPGDSTKRHCESCKKSVVNLQGMSEYEVELLFQQSPNCCVSFTIPSNNIKWTRNRGEGNRFDPCPTRRILTAKGEQEINEGAINGFWPLVKRADLDPSATKWRAIYQNRENGEVQIIEDPRQNLLSPWKRILTPLSSVWHSREPYFLEAYLLPRDLQIGENVFLDDVIRDKQQPVIDSAYAIWNGKEFQIGEIFKTSRWVG